MKLLAPLIALGLCVAVLSSCGSPEEATSNKTETAPTTTASAPVSGSHDVICGCKLPEVGKCGEFVALDGKFVALELPADHGMGRMPFCANPAAVPAQVEGTLEDGRVVATSFALDKK